MKYDSNKEIDILLRRHTGRDAVASARITEHAPDENGVDGRLVDDVAHLDADELNAYAENALPPATRARFAKHLADCDACRHIVIDLAAAANIAGELEKQVAAPPISGTKASWGGWLAALFAPSVLRYAVPALALVSITFVAFIVWRGGQRPSIVPQSQTTNEDSNAPANAQNPTPQGQSAPVAPGGTNNNATQGADGTIAQNNGPGNQPEPGKESDKQQQPASESVDEQPAVTLNAPAAPAQQEEVPPREQPPSLASKAAPPPPMADERSKDAKRENNYNVGGVDAKASSAGSGSPNVDSVKSAEIGQSSSTRPSDSESASAARKRAGRSRADAAKPQGGAVRNETESVTAEDRDERAAERRSAGGRQFVRRGNVWVDTAYKTSRATVNVSRNSEQYRALVADEPGIRTIAEQLGGTVIIVWKGRAYRIY